MHVLPPHRRRWHPGILVAAFSAALAALMCAGPGRAILGAIETSTVGWRTDSLSPTDTWNTLTLDMTVASRRLSAAGAVIAAPSAATTYRFERSSRSGSWKSVLTVVAFDRSPRYSLSGVVLPQAALPVARIEDDENGTPVRAYRPDGTLLQSTAVPFNPLSAPAGGVNTSTQPRVTGRQWIDALVPPASKKSERQLDFERRFGRATKAGTLNRYYRKETDGSEEILVDPKAVVPMHASSVRNNLLMSHRTFSYGPAPNQALVRLGMHVDQVVSTETGERSVVDTAFSNIRLERR